MLPLYFQNISDPNMAVLGLNNLSSVLEVSETLNLMQALTEVLGNYSASERFGQVRMQRV